MFSVSSAGVHKLCYSIIMSDGLRVCVCVCVTGLRDGRTDGGVRL